MVKLNRIAYGVRVKLNSNFEERCMGDKYLKEERILFIADEKPYNDSKGYYVNVRGGSLVNSGQVYLNEIDLEFEVPEYPLYRFDEKSVYDSKAAEDHYQKLKQEAAENISNIIYSAYDNSVVSFLAGCKFKEQQIRGNTKQVETQQEK